VHRKRAGIINAKGQSQLTKTILKFINNSASQLTLTLLLLTSVLTTQLTAAPWITPGDLWLRAELICQSLGHRLRQSRIKHNESQLIFAQRIGVSRQTYAKMENGHLTTPIGLWINAS